MNAPVNLDTVQLSADQDNALQKFVAFLCDPKQHVFLLEGYSGTGKTTLIRVLMDRLDKYIAMTKLVWTQYPDYVVQLTATTNKAAETFSKISGREVRTIHSFLELKLVNDIRTGFKVLEPKGTSKKSGYLLFVDEASFLDKRTLNFVFTETENCKIVLIGDRAQLLSPKSFDAPAFNSGFNGAMLSEVMRQLVNGVPQSNPITELATMFRERVNGGPWPSFKPDGQFVRYMDRSDFEDDIIDEFTRPDWSYHDSKVLAYTNDCVIAYNNAIRSQVAGDPKLQPGDYAENNSFISVPGAVGMQSLKTDQLVYINSIEDDIDNDGVMGNWMQVDYKMRVFHPHDRRDKKAYLNRMRAEHLYTKVRDAENWVDLRAVFAQTVNKSQGSTYKKVYIDLDNVKACTHGNQLARMMYVAVSRATSQVVLTGDLV